ncbi:hypothetical protein Scep_020433 [Stephania cephalantha]|uniref:Glycosyltransferase n=1 Tax=Stephania cephalantha TaxID=152367 RepID=A0AAP0NNZ8_9MAGN
MTTAVVDRPLHVALFPWLAFGHLIPYLELGKALALRGIKVSYISTPRNNQRLPKTPPSIVSNFTYVSLPLPPSPSSSPPNLPANAEATRDVRYEEIPFLKAAFDGLQVPMEHFLENARPDWIVYDFAPHWLPPIASNLGIHRAFFSIFHASTICFFGPPMNLLKDEDPRTKPEDFTVPPTWIHFPSNMAFRLHEILKVFDILQVNQSGVSDKFRYSNCLINCEISLARGCNEFDGEYMKASQAVAQKPVIPVGVLPPVPSPEDEEDQSENWVGIKEWLNERQPNSVVYVAFGSEAKISQDEITEVAMGLDQSGLHFLWALKKSENDYSLPEGYEERVREKGQGRVLSDGWVPQLRILGHGSVGAFLTHCGWGSAVESLVHGLPMVCMPLGSEQGLVARAMEWKKVGVEIEREDERTGRFTRGAVAKALKFVTLEEEGMEIRVNAAKMKGIYGNRALQDRYVDDFVRYLMRERENNVAS